MIKRRYIIYSLSDPRTNEIRYVGKSTYGPCRGREKHTAHCGSWIKSLKNVGLKPEIDILEEFDPIEDNFQKLSDAEKFWIGYLRFVGSNLTNMAQGGEGGRTHDFSTECRVKLSLPRPNACGRIPWNKGKNVPTGKKQTPEHVAKRISVMCQTRGFIQHGR